MMLGAMPGDGLPSIATPLLLCACQREATIACFEKTVEKRKEYFICALLCGGDLHWHGNALAFKFYVKVTTISYVVNLGCWLLMHFEGPL